MKNPLLRSLFSIKNYSRNSIVLGVLSGVAVSTLTWLFFVQWTTVTPKRAIFGLFTLIFTVITMVLLMMWFLENIRLPKSSMKWFYLASGLMAVVLIVSLHPSMPSNVLFSPVSELVIATTGERNPLSAGTRVSVRSFETELANQTQNSQISYQQFIKGPEWYTDEFVMKNDGVMPDEITWRGKAGLGAELSFNTGPEAGIVRVAWNGVEQIIDLYSPQATNIKIVFSFSRPLLDWITTWGSVFVLFSIVIFFLLVLLCQIKPSTPTTEVGGWGWLWYGLPPLLIWFTYLLVFFPGLMSSDSISQWGQAQRFELVDWHSPFHTFSIWLLTRIWLSPAPVIIVQILAGSMVVAWGLRELRQIGTPRWAAIAISLLFALSPANSVMMIILWKDIPYSIALLALSILTIKIVSNHGEWLSRRWSWIGLGFVSLLVGLYRQNGFVTAGVILFLFFLFYRVHWKKIIAAVVLFVAGYFGITGPVYTLMKVDQRPAYSNAIPLFHISAHVDNGTWMSGEEKEYLYKLLPEETWENVYQSCCVNSVLFNEQFNKEFFLYSDQSTPRILFFNLFFRNPIVNLRHMIASGSLVWEINSSCYLYYSPLTLQQTDDMPHWQIRWIAENEYGLREESRLEMLVYPFAEFFRLSNDIWLLWRPAVYLLWIIFVCISISLRLRSLEYMLLAIPAVTQSAVLFAVSVAQDFRYQFPVVLMGLLWTGLLFTRGVSKTGE